MAAAGVPITFYLAMYTCAYFLNIELRTEGRRGYGGKSPEVKKRRSCSPLRKRRRSQTPGGCGKEQNALAHEVLKGILKKSESGKAHRKIFQEDKILEKEVKIARKKETIPQGSKQALQKGPKFGTWSQMGPKCQKGPYFSGK